MRTLEFLRTRAPLALKTVVVPPGIKVTGRSALSGLHIEMDPGRHTAEDLVAAIVANNPADAAYVRAEPDGVVFYPNGGRYHISVGANPLQG